MASIIHPPPAVAELDFTRIITGSLSFPIKETNVTLRDILSLFAKNSPKNMTKESEIIIVMRL